MTRRVPCPECSHPLSVVPGSRAKPTALGVLRHKRCTACGTRATTVELVVGDIPRLARDYMTVDQRN